MTEHSRRLYHILRQVIFELSHAGRKWRQAPCLEYAAVSAVSNAGNPCAWRFFTVWWSNFDPWNPKFEISCKVQRRPTADIILKESLPPKTPLWTPCSWPPWPWSSHEKLLKIFKISWKIQKVDPHFKNLYHARKWLWRAHISLVWKLGLRATHSVLQHFWSDHLLEHSKAMNEPLKTCKWPWRIKV